MAVSLRSVGLVAAGLILLASPSWGQYLDNRAPNTTVYTSPALGGGQGGYGGGTGTGASPYGSAYTAPAAAEPLPVDAAGRVEVRLQALEEQIRRLTGRLEEVQHQNAVLKDRVERMQADMELRFKELATTPAAPPAAAAPAAPPAREGTLGSLPQKPGDRPAAGKSILPAGTPKQQYEFAFNLVRTDYAQAEAALREFITQHPNDALVGNAHYWLGETYYVRNDFQQAAVSFLTVYQKHPKNSKAPDSLLKLGLSLAGLGKKTEACAAIAKMAKEYPAAADSLKKRATAERSKLGCG